MNNIHIGLALSDSNDITHLQNFFETNFPEAFKFHVIQKNQNDKRIFSQMDFFVMDMNDYEIQSFDIHQEIPIILYITGGDLHELHSAIKKHPFDIWLKDQTTDQEKIGSINRILKLINWASETERLKKSIEVIPVSLLISNTEGIVEYVNPQFEKVSGYSAGELIGKNPRVLKSGKHDAKFYKEMWKVISDGLIWEGEICNKSKEGRFYWERQMIVPVINKRNEITHYIGLRIDDTDRKRAEEAMRKAEALRSVKELAGGIAHEFSQPLQVLTISMSMLELQFNKNELFERCQKMIKRIIDLVGNLKNITELKQQDYLQTKILDIRKSSENNKNDLETDDPIPDSNPEAT
jgi:PAS domain S-box-containing protein